MRRNTLYHNSVYLILLEFWENLEFEMNKTKFESITNLTFLS